MPAWVPLARAVLPYLTSIASAAIPAFATRKDHAKSLELQAEQIATLEAAVTHNAAAIKTLAEQLEKTVTAIDAGAATVEPRIARLTRQLHRAWIVSLVSLMVAALCIVFIALHR
ncbi:MAG: hypothetical protein ACYDC8_06760 [Gammaproteobacteria bacterium]